MSAKLLIATPVSGEDDVMKIERVWAMPNKATFSIKPIGELVIAEMCNGVWIDPFSGGAQLATLTNDLNPEVVADFHMDALEWLQSFGRQQVQGVLYDPPYSVRQVAECYKNVGLPVTQETTRSSWYTNIKREIARIIEPGGKCISCGWHSNGIGADLGFEKTRILLVAHGGCHNDTIVTVDKKIQGTLL